MRNGVRHEESSRSATKQKAIDLLKVREGDVAKGLPVTAKMLSCGLRKRPRTS